MKEYFFEEKDKVYIFDDKKGLIVENNKDNNMDIFKTQNNIEFIEKTINEEKNIKNNLQALKKTMKSQSIILGILVSILLCVLLPLVTITTSIPNLLIILLFSGSISLMPFVGIKEYNDLKKKILAKEIYINELNNELEEEKSILNIFKLDSKAKYANNDITVRNDIKPSNLLNELKRKKELIMDFYHNKKYYIELYKKGKINELVVIYNYNNDDIDFINCLIKELGVEDNKSKQKQKRKCIN